MTPAVVSPGVDTAEVTGRVRVFAALVVGVGAGLGNLASHQVLVLLEALRRDLVRVDRHLEHFALGHSLLRC